MIPDVVVPQDCWKSHALREAAKYVNLVAILAKVHRRPEAIEFLTYLGIRESGFGKAETPSSDSPHPGPRSVTDGPRGKRVSRSGPDRTGKSGNVA